MTYHVESRWGGSEIAPSEVRMRELLAELDEIDPEHPDTWLTHESGWTLAIHETGLVVWENLDLPEQPRHIANVDREKALRLWLRLAAGDLASLEQEPWQAGYGSRLSNEESVARQREIAEFILAQDRQFYDSLGEERSEIPCRETDCARGAIRLSVLCRAHHFESIKGKPSPFSH